MSGWADVDRNRVHRLSGIWRRIHPSTCLTGKGQPPGIYTSLRLALLLAVAHTNDHCGGLLVARTGITFDDVSQAAESLVARGEDITIISIRKELGDTGSMTTIQRYLAEWRSEHQNRRVEIGDMPEALEKAFKRCLGDLWQTSQQIAKADVDQIRTKAHNEAQMLSKDLSEACAAYDSEALELRRLREEMKVIADERDEAVQSASVLAAGKAELERQFEDVVGRLEGRLSELTKVVDSLAGHHAKPETPAGPNKAVRARRRANKKTISSGDIT